MNESAADLETLLRTAFAPVEPPADLVERLEQTLVNLTTLAADELEQWELSAMRDPRNWVRPAAAVVIGAGATTALAVVRVRQKRHRRKGEAAHVGELAARAFGDFTTELRRILDETDRRR